MQLGYKHFEPGTRRLSRFFSVSHASLDIGFTLSHFRLPFSACWKTCLPEASDFYIEVWSHWGEISSTCP